MNFLTIGKEEWFSSFLLYSVLLLNCRNCKRLSDFEEKEISRQGCIEVTVNSRGENIKTQAPIEA
jgi:hypothetical protein